MTAELLPVLSEGAGRAPSFDGLDEVAEASSWARVTVGELTIEGPAGWRDVLGRAALPHRRQLLDALGASWSSNALVATRAARARLRDWYVAGRPVPTPDDLVRRLSYLGDTEVRSIVLKALDERVPAPVVDFLLVHALVAGSGWSAGGWTIQTALEGGPRVVVLLSGAARDADALLDLVLHELAHAWLIPTPSSPLRPDEMFNANAASLIEAAARPEQMAAWLRVEDEAERQADALARGWGAGLRGSNDRAREHTLAHAAHLQRVYGGAR